jgi:glycosyltransferase involved in cell wall biosynthesis
LVHLQDNELFRITIPSKTQAYMVAGRPILMAVRGDAADLVKRADAGICCSPEAPEEISEALLALHAMPQADRERLGANGLTFYERELSLSAGVGRFEELFLKAGRSI